MSVVGSLIAYGLRQVVGDAATDPAGQILAVVRNYWTDHGQALPDALARANDRAWQAVGLALAGDGLWDRVKDVFRDGDLKGVRDQIKKFLDQTPTGMESTSPNIRSKAVEEWRRLRKAGRLSAESVPSDELANQAAALDRYSDPTRVDRRRPPRRGGHGDGSERSGAAPRPTPDRRPAGRRSSSCRRVHLLLSP